MLLFVRFPFTAEQLRLLKGCYLGLHWDCYPSQREMPPLSQRGAIAFCWFTCIHAILSLTAICSADQPTVLSGHSRGQGYWDMAALLLSPPASSLLIANNNSLVAIHQTTGRYCNQTERKINKIASISHPHIRQQHGDLHIQMLISQSSNQWSDSAWLDIDHALCGRDFRGSCVFRKKTQRGHHMFFEKTNTGCSSGIYNITKLNSYCLSIRWESCTNIPPCPLVTEAECSFVLPLILKRRQPQQWRNDLCVQLSRPNNSNVERGRVFRSLSEGKQM